MLVKWLDDEVLNAFDGICYALDLEGNIVGVGPDNWNRFANLAGDTTPGARAVKRRNLFDFIAGDQVRDQLRDVMDKLISGTATDWVMPYRCDAPDTKRNMRISLRPIKNGEAVIGFLFQSVTLDESQRPPLDIFEFMKIEETLKKEGEFPLVSMCSYCQRVKDGLHTSGEWTEAETYYANGGTSRVRLSHGICPNCRETAIASFKS